MKLIPLDAVLAEIENLLDKGKYHNEYDCAYRDGNNGALYALKSKLNSLEVKGVIPQIIFQRMDGKSLRILPSISLNLVCKLVSLSQQLTEEWQRKSSLT